MFAEKNAMTDCHGVKTFQPCMADKQPSLYICISISLSVIFVKNNTIFAQKQKIKTAIQRITVYYRPCGDHWLG